VKGLQGAPVQLEALLLQHPHISDVAVIDKGITWSRWWYFYCTRYWWWEMWWASPSICGEEQWWAEWTRSGGFCEGQVAEHKEFVSD